MAAATRNIGNRYYYHLKLQHLLLAILLCNTEKNDDDETDSQRMHPNWIGNVF